MSFWKTLGKIGMIAGPLAAIPFTGGLSALGIGAGAGGATGAGAAGGGLLSGILGAASKVAPALGALAQGRADARVTQNNANTQHDLLALQRSRQEQEQTNAQNVFNQRNYDNALQGGQLDLQRKGFQLQAPQARAKNSVRGDYLANAQNTTISTPEGWGGGRLIHINRGFGPSNFSQNTRSLGQAMSQQALEGQQAGDKFADLPSMPSYVSGAPIPGLSEMPQAGALDKVLTTAGTIGSLYGNFDDFLNKYRDKGIRGDKPMAGGTGLPIGNSGIPTFGGWANG